MLAWVWWLDFTSCRSHKKKHYCPTCLANSIKRMFCDLFCDLFESFACINYFCGWVAFQDNGEHTLLIYLSQCASGLQSRYGQPPQALQSPYQVLPAWRAASLALQTQLTKQHRQKLLQQSNRLSTSVSCLFQVFCHSTRKPTKTQSKDISNFTGSVRVFRSACAILVPSNYVWDSHSFLIFTKSWMEHLIFCSPSDYMDWQLVLLCISQMINNEYLLGFNLYWK